MVVQQGDEVSQDGRRGRCLAYALLACAAVTFAFEAGRQSGAAQTWEEAYRHADRLPGLTSQLADEVVRLRARPQPL